MAVVAVGLTQGERYTFGMIAVIEVHTNRLKEGQKVVPGQGESQCPL